MPETKNQPQDNKGQLLASWKFPEYIKHKRSKKWYFWAIIIMLAFLIYAFFTFNILFAIIIILFAVILYLHSKAEPVDVEFKICQKGIQIGSRFHRYKELNSFWIIYEPPTIKTLYLNFKTKLRPTLAIPLQKQNPLRIRKILREYIDEDLEKDEETFSEILGRRLKI